MDVICAGMLRSGSTWQYLIAAHLIEKYKSGIRGGATTPTRYTGPSQTWRVVKTHDDSAQFEACLAAGQACALYSYRDLRDVAYSLTHKFSTTFEDIAEERRLLEKCMATNAFWTAQPYTLIQRYEEIFQDPARAIEQIAEHLDIRLAPGEAATIAEEYSLEANRKRTRELKEHFEQRGMDLSNTRNTCRHDQETLLHWNHIRKGGQGDWLEQITPRELAYFAATCTEWLIQWGYETDADWWKRVCSQRGWSSDHVLAAYLEAEQQRLEDRRRSQVLLQRLNEPATQDARLHDDLSRVNAELTQIRAELGRLQNLLAGTGPRTLNIGLGVARFLHLLTLTPRRGDRSTVGCGEDTDVSRS